MNDLNSPKSVSYSHSPRSTHKFNKTIRQFEKRVKENKLFANTSSSLIWYDQIISNFKFYKYNYYQETCQISLLRFDKFLEVLVLFRPKIPELCKFRIGFSCLAGHYIIINIHVSDRIIFSIKGWIQMNHEQFCIYLALGIDFLQVLTIQHESYMLC